MTSLWSSSASPGTQLVETNELVHSVIIGWGVCACACVDLVWSIVNQFLTLCDGSQVSSATPRSMRSQNKVTSHVSNLVLGAVIALIGGSCTSAGSHHQTSRDEFARVASWPMGTWQMSEVIGATDTTAFMRVWTADPRVFGGGDHVYSIPLKDLSTSEVAQIRAGKNPWKD